MTQDADKYSVTGEVGSVLEKRTTWARLKIDLKKSLGRPGLVL